MLKAEQYQPVKGDWFSDVSNSLNQMGIQLNLEGTQKINRKEFRKIIKNACEKTAFADLKQRQENGSKGKNIQYGNKFQMADYLCPNVHMIAEDQRILF